MSALARRLVTFAHARSGRERDVLNALRHLHHHHPVIVSRVYIARPCAHAAPCACLFRAGGALETLDQRRDVMMRMSERAVTAEATQLFGQPMIARRPTMRSPWTLWWMDGPSASEVRATLAAHRWPRMPLHRSVSLISLQSVAARAASFYGTPDFVTICQARYRQAPGVVGGPTVILTVLGASLQVAAGALTVARRPIDDAIRRIVLDPRRRLLRPRDSELQQWFASKHAPARTAAFHLLGMAPGATG